VLWYVKVEIDQLLQPCDLTQNPRRGHFERYGDLPIIKLVSRAESHRARRPVDPCIPAIRRNRIFQLILAEAPNLGLRSPICIKSHDGDCQCA